MWKEFKFAIDLREGDTKPVPKDALSKAGSKSILDASYAGAGDGSQKKAGGGGDSASKAATSEDESPYATFNDTYSTKSKQ